MKWYKVGEKTPKTHPEYETSEALLLSIPSLICVYYTGFYVSNLDEFRLEGGIRVNPTHWAYIKPPKEEKTTMEWLYWAKDQGFEWAESAIENAKSQKGEGYTGGKHKSLRQSLRAAFAWRYTPERYDHWKQISNSLTC